MALCLTCCYESGCYSCADRTENALFGKSKHGWLNFICSPIALVVHSVYAYVFVCIGVYIGRFLNHVLCYACIYKGTCNSCYLYRDKRFPANDESLGVDNNDDKIIWKRATEVIERPVLFKNSVEPSDVKQGGLGNCWLMSALASVAEFPGLADKIFVNREKSTRGKYSVRIYDGYCKGWKVVTVDDFFPMEATGTITTQTNNANDQAKDADATNDIEAGIPNGNYKFKFAQPDSTELWVPVLEKAFAKFRGSYENLNGGNTLWAFHALTGDNCFRLQKCEEEDRKGIWQKLVLAYEGKPTDKAPVKVGVTKECILETKMHGLLRVYDRSQALIGASMKSAEDESGKTVERKDEETGLVRGHAYSLLQAKTVALGSDTIDLVQLRNPWGSLEWNGDWSDNSRKWDEHPEVAQAVGFNKNDDDGTFWMDYNDFARLFDNIDICDRTVNYTDFSLDVHENPENCRDHSCGPTKGCFEGCFDFWCLCKGIKYIYCGNESKSFMKKAVQERDDTFFKEITQL